MDYQSSKQSIQSSYSQVQVYQFCPLPAFQCSMPIFVSFQDLLSPKKIGKETSLVLDKIDSSILWWVGAYNWSIWEEKWCSHTSYTRRFVMSLFRDYTFQYGLLLPPCCRWCYKTSPFPDSLSLYSVGENWTKKDMSCYAAFLSYFSSLEVRYYELSLFQTRCRGKNKF